MLTRHANPVTLAPIDPAADHSRKPDAPCIPSTVSSLAITQVRVWAVLVRG